MNNYKELLVTPEHFDICTEISGKFSKERHCFFIRMNCSIRIFTEIIGTICLLESSVKEVPGIKP